MIYSVGVVPDEQHIMKDCDWLWERWEGMTGGGGITHTRIGIF